MDVALLGAGHIARCLAEGWAEAQASAGWRPGLVVYDPVPERATLVAGLCAGRAVESARAAVQAGEIVIVATRPQHVAAALADVKRAIETRPVVSLAAYVTLSQLAAALAPGARVGRLMPSVAAAVRRAQSLLAEGTLGEAVDTVTRLFALVGEVVSVDEDLFDAATALSGCGPGFAAHFLAALVDGGVRAGLERELALRLASGALAGAAALTRRGEDPGELVRAVAVAGGMTAAGIEVLDRGGVGVAVAAAVEAAVQRARERR